jgi:hypothetical protein
MRKGGVEVLVRNVAWIRSGSGDKMRPKGHLLGCDATDVSKKRSVSSFTDEVIQRATSTLLQNIGELLPDYTASL